MLIQLPTFNIYCLTYYLHIFQETESLSPPEELFDVFTTEQENVLPQLSTLLVDKEPTEGSVDEVDAYRKTLWQTKWKFDTGECDKLNGLLGRRTAADGCETPDKPGFASDDMLYGTSSKGDVSSGIVHTRERPEHYQKKPSGPFLSQPPCKTASMEDIPDTQETPLFTHQILFGSLKPAGISKSGSFDDISTMQRSKAKQTLKRVQQSLLPDAQKNTTQTKAKSSGLDNTNPVAASSTLKNPTLDFSAPVSSQTKARSSGFHTTNPGAASSTESLFLSDARCPLASSILSLTCEVLSNQNSWTSIDHVQQAFVGVFGGLFEWYVYQLHILVCSAIGKVLWG